MKLLIVALFTVFVLGCAGQATTSVDGAAASSDAYTRLGMKYLQDGNMAGAKTSFQKALAVYPKDALALNGLALAFQVEGEAKLAETYFQKASRYAPESATIHNNYGAFLFSEARYEEACSVLAVATQDPFYSRRAAAFENLGRCYQHLGSPSAAKHAYKRALALSPGRIVTNIFLADLELDAANLQEAVALFSPFEELVEKRQIDHFPLSLWVGVRVYRGVNDAQSAATYALLLKNLFPNSAEYKEFQESGL